MFSFPNLYFIKVLFMANIFVLWIIYILHIKNTKDNFTHIYYTFLQICNLKYLNVSFS